MAENQTSTETPAAAQPDAQPSESIAGTKPPGSSRLGRFKAWYGARKRWAIPATVLLLVLLLAAVPFTRYNLAGLVVKSDLTLRILDSTSNTPVSGATVSLGTTSVQTDGSGMATFHHLKAGHHKLILSKKYYQDKTIDALAPILGSKKESSVQMIATGRQVRITVTNLINKEPIADANIKVAGTTAKTDKTGNALIVLPVGTTEQEASLSANGFNDSSVNIKVSSDKIQDNPFSLTPSGKVYFLSKLSGKIDVVKTNLDGTKRDMVMAGTGKEDDRSTVLLAARDWKYLALLSKRAGASPSLYLINTADDSSTVIDEGSADFTLTGWAGDNFIYTVSRTNVPLWQNGRQVLKSYNAATKKAIVLDQTTATGSDSFSYVSELIGNTYAYEDQVFYIKNWSSAFSSAAEAQLVTKQATFNSIKPDGTGKKSIRSFGLAPGALAADITLDSRIKAPDNVELSFSDGTKNNFYTYANGQVKDDTVTTIEGYYASIYSTYLLSPSGSKTFWSESRDGKNSLFIGDEEGQGGKQVSALSDYNTYGWYTDDYLLVSKSSSELYVMDKNAKQAPVKISDYHKPALIFQGYGGGYGGL
jgi:hypothetical protein